MRNRAARTSIVLALLFVAGALPKAAGTTYYLSAGGDDRNDGRAPDRAWRNIGRANAVDFEPGDRLLFEGGQLFDGNLVIGAEDAGTPSAPVIVSSYGAGRATIRAGLGTAILVKSAGGIQIENIVLEGASRTTNEGSGLRIVNELPASKTLEFVRVDNVEARGFGQDGIFVGGEASDGSRSGYHDVRITNCDVHDNEYFGLRVGAPERIGRNFANSRVYVGRCRAYDNPGDPLFMENHSGSGIFLAHVDGGVIEHSVAYNNGNLCNSSVGGPIGIWAASSNRIVIQSSESYKNRTGTGRKDGGGFDFDGGVTNSVMQYNYSHDNDGAGFMFYTYPDSGLFSGNTLRYNITENDSRLGPYAGIYIENGGESIADTEVYHNTVYLDRSSRGGGRARAVNIHRTIKTHFRNNILITSGGMPFATIAPEQPGLLVQGNAYSSVDRQFRYLAGGRILGSLSEWRTETRFEMLGDGREVGVEVNPLLGDFGSGVTIGGTADLSTLPVYRLRADSPLIDAGLDLRQVGIEPGLRDFFGTPIPQGAGFDIGAHEFRRNPTVSSPLLSVLPLVDPPSRRAR